MPGLDLLDAFAELVVCVVFNLPHDKPQPATSTSSSSSDGDGDDDDDLSGANSSSTTQIFSRVNSIDDGRPTPLSTDAAMAHSGNGRDAAAGVRSSNSLQSLDHYPGGIWNAVTQQQQQQQSSSQHRAYPRPPPTSTTSLPHLTSTVSSLSIAATTSGSGASSGANSTGAPTTPSHQSSITSLNTGDLSTPRSSGHSTDRNVGFWNRLLGGSGVLHTPPRSTSYGQLPTNATGVSTNASSYVQLNEEDLGMTTGSGRAMSGGGAAAVTFMWPGFSTTTSAAQLSSQPQLDMNGDDSRGAGTPSTRSTPVDEEAGRLSPGGTSMTQVPMHQPASSLPPQQQQHGLYVAARQSASPNGNHSQASSSSEFIVL